jgi:hypothetical protein
MHGTTLHTVSMQFFPHLYRRRFVLGGPAFLGEVTPLVTGCFPLYNFSVTI